MSSTKRRKKWKTKTNETTKHRIGCGDWHWVSKVHCCCWVRRLMTDWSFELLTLESFVIRNLSSENFLSNRGEELDNRFRAWSSGGGLSGAELRHCELFFCLSFLKLHQKLKRLKAFWAQMMKLNHSTSFVKLVFRLAWYQRCFCCSKVFEHN